MWNITKHYANKMWFTIDLSAGYIGFIRSSAVSLNTDRCQTCLRQDKDKEEISILHSLMIYVSQFLCYGEIFSLPLHIELYTYVTHSIF